MGLFDRTQPAHRNNPERELEQIARDLQEELLVLRQAVASAIALQKRTERQQFQEQAVAEGLHQRAKVALLREDEATARAALLRRQPHLKNARALQLQIAQQQQIVEQMRANLHHLEGKIAELRTKKELFVARARSAEAGYRVQELSSARAASDRLEEQVMRLEAEGRLRESRESDRTGLNSSHDLGG